MRDYYSGSTLVELIHLCSNNGLYNNYKQVTEAMTMPLKLQVYHTKFLVALLLQEIIPILCLEYSYVQDTRREGVK